VERFVERRIDDVKAHAANVDGWIVWKAEEVWGARPVKQLLSFFHVTFFSFCKGDP
jgi:hypothetical protein